MLRFSGASPMTVGSPLSRIRPGSNGCATSDWSRTNTMCPGGANRAPDPALATSVRFDEPNSPIQVSSFPSCPGRETNS